MERTLESTTNGLVIVKIRIPIVSWQKDMTIQFWHKTTPCCTSWHAPAGQHNPQIGIC